MSLVEVMHRDVGDMLRCGKRVRCEHRPTRRRQPAGVGLIGRLRRQAGPAPRHSEVTLAVRRSAGCSTTDDPYQRLRPRSRGRRRRPIAHDCHAVVGAMAGLAGRRVDRPGAPRSPSAAASGLESAPISCAGGPARPVGARAAAGDEAGIEGNFGVLHVGGVDLGDRSSGRALRRLPRRRWRGLPRLPARSCWA